MTIIDFAGLESTRSIIDINYWLRTLRKLSADHAHKINKMNANTIPENNSLASGSRLAFVDFALVL